MPPIKHAVILAALALAASTARAESSWPALGLNYRQALKVVKSDAAAGYATPEVGPAAEVPAAQDKKPADLGQAQRELEKAIAQIQGLLDAGGLKPEQELSLYKTLTALQAALGEVKSANSSSGSAEKLDRLIQEAAAVQKIMGAYFGNKGTFGYELKRGTVEIAIGGDVVLDEVIRRIGLGGTRVGGSFRVNPGREIVTQFNSLKVEYYGILARAAGIDRKNRTVVALSDWARDTKVIYPGQTFGEPIFTGTEYRNIVGF